MPQKTGQTTEQEIKIIPYRTEGHKRVFSNHVEITKTPTDLNIKFCDVKPPESEEELHKVKREMKIRIPVDCEVILPISIAQDLAKILEEQLKERV